MGSRAESESAWVHPISSERDIAEHQHLRHTGPESANLSPDEWRRSDALVAEKRSFAEPKTEKDDIRTLLASSDSQANDTRSRQPNPIPWSRSLTIGLKTFWNWFFTPWGFLVAIYSLNVVAWGGMLFLLLCNAALAMGWANDEQLGWNRDCDHLYSSRRIWLETDSQILDAMFCVPGFGLIHWRFRDLYYLLRWRLLSEGRYGRQQKVYGLRTLAKIYKSWFRLPGSDTLDRLDVDGYGESLITKPSTKYEAQLPSVLAGSLDSRIPWKPFKTPPTPVTAFAHRPPHCGQSTFPRGATCSTPFSKHASAASCGA